MSCYCANYYGPINCHNSVSKFGDRCAHCLSTEEGSSSNVTIRSGVPQPTEQRAENSNRERMKDEEERSKGDKMHGETSGKAK